MYCEKTAEVGGMKKKVGPAKLPELSKEEVSANVAKSAAIFFRLTKAEKEAVDSTAKSLHLSVGEYLMKCHDLVSKKLR